MSREEWRRVPSNPEILVSSMGRVLLPPSRALMPHGGHRLYIPEPVIGSVSRAKAGATHCYRNIWVKRYGNMKVHQLVCEAFHGEKPAPDSVVIHKDEDGLNNRRENLRWGTQKENLNMPKIKAFHRSRTGDRSPYAIHRAKAA